MPALIYIERLHLSINQLWQNRIYLNLTNYLPDQNYCIEFLTSDSIRVGEYDIDSGEPESIRIKNAKIKIDRISIR